MKTQFLSCQVILAFLEYINGSDVFGDSYLGLLCFLKVRYLMPLHFWDTKTFKLQDEGGGNDMTVACLVHAKNELFFFQTYFYCCTIFCPTAKLRKKIKTEMRSMNLYTCIIHVYLSSIYNVNHSQSCSVSCKICTYLHVCPHVLSV